MSHFTVMVICPKATTVADHRERVTELLAPYDENRDVEWRPDENAEEGGYWTNPDGHWDWWTVGGRWRGYFPVANGLSSRDLAELLVTDGRPNRMTGVHDGFDPQMKEGRADGGPKRCLGFDKLRDQRGQEAVEEWNSYAAAVDGTEPHIHWDVLMARVQAAHAQAEIDLGADRRGLIRRCGAEVCAGLGMEADEEGHPRGATDHDWELFKARDKELWATYEQQWKAACTYDWDQARADYWRSDRVSAVNRHPVFKDRFMDADEIDALDRSTRDEYEQRARTLAVPTFAVVMADGTWCAPGRMGWFGASSDSEGDRIGFAERMNTYLDSLDDETFLAVVDCHV